MKLRYLSHSCFLLTVSDNQKIIIDPFISGNPLSPVKAEDIEADYILITHGHGDHLGDTIEIAKRCNSLCICENELANYLISKGVRAHTMHIGGVRQFDFGWVKLTQALHGSCTPDQECYGTASGFIITCDDKKFYHTGDTGLFSDMKLIGELNKIDYMMVPIGDNFTMGIDDSVIASDFVKPKNVIPMHYNTFPIINADPYEFKNKVEKHNIKCIVLEFGQEIQI